MTNEIILRKSFWSQFDPSKTLLVFPGNGASIVCSFVSDAWLSLWHWTTVHAKRYWFPGEDPRVEVSRIFPNAMMLGIKNVVVIDDVVSSGKTANILRERNRTWLPGANWNLVVWVAERVARLKGYSSFISTLSVGEDNRKVPINSLSTLVEDKEIAGSYIDRNFFSWDKSVLNKLLNDLRR